MNINELADAARSDEATYGTNEHIDAINAFFAACEAQWPHLFYMNDKFEAFCLKATEDEMIDEALKMIAGEAGK